jgi:malonyl-CoA O-methyltransferase
MASSPTPINPAQGHRLWAESYDADLNPLLALERRVLQPHLDRLSGKRFVDVGCGTGRWLSLAREAGADVLGFDLTREMLTRAAAKPALKGKLVCADAQRLPIADATADVTLSSFCISYVEDLPAVFSCLARITKPGGRIIISDIHPGAASAGWKRTFRSAGKLYEMNLAARPKKNPFRAGLDAGLTLWRVLEPSFGEAERPLFDKAGKGDSFETVSAIPALLVSLWDRGD